ncbi:MAG: hypothetical protein HHJ09_00590 [Glaciimonas sp.]|nr:hypothetical protein [Glaciimonas sp.]
MAVIGPTRNCLSQASNTMNSPLSRLDQETIVVKDFGLQVHVIGFGTIGDAVLENIRTHFGHYPYGSLVEEKSDTGKNDELIFLVANLDIASERNVFCRAGSLVNKAAGSTLAFTFTGHTSEDSCEKLLQMNRQQSSEQINAHVVIASDRTADAKAAGKIIFERIRSIVSAMATPRSINVGFKDFCRAMTGSGKNACATIKAAWGEAHGPDRAVHAMAEALASPSFRKHLSQADGIVVKITGNSKNLMGREVKQISKEIQKHIAEDCVWLGSICYDQDMPSDVLKLEILTSHWTA